MLFKLPDLSYSYQDMEPYIDRKTMEIHHKKHHYNYINSLNNAISNTDMINLSIKEILRRSHIESPVIQNNSGGVYNHNFFWKILIPSSKFESPGLTFNNIINKNFNSFNSFKEKFSNIALNHFGSGWIWLCINNKKKLNICSTSNQDNPIMYGTNCEGIPILGLDIWEHAYYLQYQNRRSDYISSFWKIINWKQVENNYLHAIETIDEY
ncbi:superoxide dismutase [Blattabacterium cuenoti]|uniref:superoxide dismutase n=1 Tax=Blattabacterium cuenoti TaxID=1653831 RepID=UPI00163C4BA6|nr:superoxide dismutase [Blattabacterium cuenoti]